MRASRLALAALVAVSLVATTVSAFPWNWDPSTPDAPANDQTDCQKQCIATRTYCENSSFGGGEASCIRAFNDCSQQCINDDGLAAVATSHPLKTRLGATRRPAPMCQSTCRSTRDLCVEDNSAVGGSTIPCITNYNECVHGCSKPTTEVAAPHTEKEYQTMFSSFVKKHSKKYARDEFFPRFSIFKANVNKIHLHNKGKHTYTMALNEFADMTFAEFHSKMTGYKHIDNGVHRSKNGPHKNLKHVADSLDWRTKNAVTPVKNQQGCGACWSFSSTGSVEGAHAIATGNLVSLSEQQLIDCSSAQGNNGCHGGVMDQAFQYIISNGGITTEASYPYTSAQGTCNTSVSVAATISSFVDVTSGSETALLAAVNIGPVSIAIDAKEDCLQFYSGGILSDPSCGTTLDHAVLVVGYGTDASTNTPYWIIKNSWGAAWGESGYIRMVRGQNECGLAEAPSYPVV